MKILIVVFVLDSFLLIPTPETSNSIIYFFFAQDTKLHTEEYILINTDLPI